MDRCAENGWFNLNGKFHPGQITVSKFTCKDSYWQYIFGKKESTNRMAVTTQLCSVVNAVKASIKNELQ